MKYSIVFSSHTGNTSKLAHAAASALPRANLLYFGAPNPEALAAPLIFVGFWTDKGSCDNDTKSFLESLRQKQVFLFGSAGFGGSSEYFAKILSATERHLDASNTVTGSFMCQGKMPVSVRERYEKMLGGTDDDARIEGLIKNFDSASGHPDQSDIEQLKASLVKNFIGRDLS